MPDLYEMKSKITKNSQVSEPVYSHTFFISNNMPDIISANGRINPINT
ncbi:MAG: hypothetical protein QXW78_01125 [Candidatus Thermoplasmatota archaeon]